tara:strand:+ start:217 stop:1215 length:999 start_codon:yes stop_codon:yes gene_type:complete
MRYVTSTLLLLSLCFVIFACAESEDDTTQASFSSSTPTSLPTATPTTVRRTLTLPPKKTPTATPVLVESTPTNNNNFFDEGYKYHENKDWPSAIDKFRLALVANPNHISSFYYRGISHNHMRNYSLAISDLTNVILLASDMEYVRNNSDETIVAMIEENGFASFMGKLYTLRADAFAGDNQHENVVTDITTALNDWDPALADRIVGHNLRGIAHSDLGNHSEALDDLEVVSYTIENYDLIDILEVPYIKSLLVQGLDLISLNREEESVQVFSKIIAFNPDDNTHNFVLTKAYLSRALAFWRLERYEESNRDIAMCKIRGGIGGDIEMCDVFK